MQINCKILIIIAMKIFLLLLICTASLIGEIIPRDIQKSPFLNDERYKEVVIIGGGPAGLTAALYSARSGLSTLVIEGEEPRGQIALSSNVENFPGFPKGIAGFDLGSNIREQAIKFGAIPLLDKVVTADLSERPFRLKLKGGKEIYAETLIIATGARTKWLGIPSEAALMGKGVNSCAICDGFLFRKKEVIVVGGGDTALEDALYLTNFATKVTVIHRRDSLRASEVLQKRAFANPKIHFIYDTVVEEILDINKGSVEGVLLKNITTNETYLYSCDGVFIAIGHVPNTELFTQSLELDSAGYIIAQPYSTKTSVPGVFAAGDVADPKYKQAIIAAGFGSMAAIDAFHFIKENQNKENL